MHTTIIGYTLSVTNEINSNSTHCTQVSKDVAYYGLHNMNKQMSISVELSHKIYMHIYIVRWERLAHRNRLRLLQMYICVYKYMSIHMNPNGIHFPFIVSKGRLWRGCGDKGRDNKENIGKCDDVNYSRFNIYTNSKVPGAKMGPIWVLSAPMLAPLTLLSG